jgi:predicted DNA-binding antitoxin AbrB/MazE fold protein
MNQVSGTYRNGAVVPDQPVDWPDGMHVKIVCESDALKERAAASLDSSSWEDTVEIEPIPMRPAGYFQFDREDIELDKRFATANVVPAPDQE